MQGNKKLSTKAQVLKTLRQASARLSGKELSSALNVSRTSIWKAVQSLQECGYKIDAQKNGYLLTDNFFDSIMPFEFENNEKQFVHYFKIESTMIEARKIALAALEGGGPTATIITADEQSAGKGRGSHLWKTTSGSLAFTMINAQKIPLYKSARLTMAAQIALANVLERMTGRPFYARWPNDVWSKDGKVAGILDEAFSSGGLCCFLNLGIGVNVSQSPKIPKAAKVFDKKIPHARKKILSDFINEFSKMKSLAEQETNALQKIWNKMNYDCGKKIRAAGANDYIFDSIDPNGWAILKNTINGAKTKFAPGSVSYEKR